jgi:hypothetical protein
MQLARSAGASLSLEGLGETIHGWLKKREYTFVERGSHWGAVPTAR